MTLDLLTCIFLIIEFGISIWNGYASGVNWGAADSFVTKAVSAITLVFAFAGTTYVIITVGAVVLNYLNFIDQTIAVLMLGYNYLVLGGVITLLGIVITLESIIVAYRTRSIGSAIIAIFNTAVSAFNVFSYVSQFSMVTNMISSESRSESKDDQGRLILIIFGLALVGLLITIAAFEAGVRRGRDY